MLCLSDAGPEPALNLYNEIDPYAARWLRNLSDAGHIATGSVEERSIADLATDDLSGYTQAHFFAGVGVWSHALRLAGWPDSRPVWTGSCPCQPFSDAGVGRGTDDERHLWPAWFRLIEKFRPPDVFGEQVASRAGLDWLDAVRADLEGAGYAFGAADLCAAGVGAPHIRQRLYFAAFRLADADSGARGQGSTELRGSDRGDAESRSGSGGGGADWLAHGAGLGRERGRAGEANGWAVEPERRRDAGGVGHHHHQGLEEQRGVSRVPCGPTGTDSREAAERASASNDRVAARDSSWIGAGATRGFWADADWLPCRDGKWRPVEPGTFPLAHGAPSRVGRLRAYGNAIVAPLAAEFIRAVMESFP